MLTLMRVFATQKLDSEHSERTLGIVANLRFAYRDFADAKLVIYVCAWLRTPNADALGIVAPKFRNEV